MAGYETISQTNDRVYLLSKSRFRKRECQSDELYLDLDDKPFPLPALSKARLENEYRTLLLINDRTGIPVPKPLGFFEENGVHVLETERAPGITLADYEGHDRTDVVKKVGQYVHQELVPQLQRLTSTTMGGLNTEHNGILLAPRFPRELAYEFPRFTSEMPEFVFCHCDLGQANIFIDPSTHQVVSVIDWEYAGYFPKEFEADLWKYHPYKQNWEEHNSEQLLSVLESLRSRNKVEVSGDSDPEEKAGANQ